jgi:hypothetical protein
VVINNNTGNGQVGLAALIAAGRVRRMICSFPRGTTDTVFPELYRSGRIEMELVPQGTLAERIRAGGAGIPAFYTATSAGTPLAEGKEQREFDGRACVMEWSAGRLCPGEGRARGSLRQRRVQQGGAQLRPHHVHGGAHGGDPGGRGRRRRRHRPGARRHPGDLRAACRGGREPALESELIASGASYP